MLLTDGETAPYFAGDLRESLRPPPRTNFVILRVGGRDERIWVNAKLDRGYRADPGAARATASLARVVNGRSYSAGQVAAATQRAKRLLGTGPLDGRRPRLARHRPGPLARARVSLPTALAALVTKSCAVTHLD